MRTRLRTNMIVIHMLPRYINICGESLRVKPWHNGLEVIIWALLLNQRNCRTHTMISISQEANFYTVNIHWLSEPHYPTLTKNDKIDKAKRIPTIFNF